MILVCYKLKSVHDQPKLLLNTCHFSWSLFLTESIWSIWNIISSQTYCLITKSPWFFSDINSLSLYLTLIYFLIISWLTLWHFWVYFIQINILQVISLVTHFFFVVFYKTTICILFQFSWCFRKGIKTLVILLLSGTCL